MSLGLSEFRWYYCFFGVVMAAAFASPAWREYDRLHRGVVTDATVTEFDSRKTTLSAGAMVRFTFADEKGREQSGTDTVYGGWYPPADNIIRIRYLPEAPGQSALLEGKVKRLPIVLFFVGVGIVILAILTEIHVRRRRRRALLERQTGDEHGTSEFRKDE